MDQQHFYQLLDSYLVEKMTAAEEQEFFVLLEQTDYQALLKEHITLHLNSDDITTEDQQRKERIKFKLNTLIEKDRTPIRRINWKRWVAAASILLAIGLGTATLVGVFTNKQTNKPPIAKTTDIPAPKNSKAIITLADGRQISLDSLTTLTQGDVTVIKDAEGKIVYSSQLATQNSQLVFNTLSNPRGSKVIDMTLSDGSHVWLNAGSSITYPIAFVGSERKISMTGEAYFEIAKHDLPSALGGGQPNQKMPFIVSANNKADVEVLGTHFNVNAYDDEQDIKVTLLEGSVKTSNNIGTVTLKPGEQARITSNIQPQTSNAVDLEKTMAWKNNDFIFDEDNLEDILRQLARWYNIDPVFTGKPDTYNTTSYTGRITRTVPISQVLAMFEKLGYVKFEINGNDVKIIPLK